MKYMELPINLCICNKTKQFNKMSLCNFYDFSISEGVASCNVCGEVLTPVMTLDEINKIEEIGLQPHACSPLPRKPEQINYTYGVDSCGRNYRDYSDDYGEHREFASFVCQHCNTNFSTTPVFCERDDTIFCCEECMNESSPFYIVRTDENGDYKEFRDGTREYVTYICVICGDEIYHYKTTCDGNTVCSRCYDGCEG